jgi:hypothetical protein
MKLHVSVIINPEDYVNIEITIYETGNTRLRSLLLLITVTEQSNISLIVIKEKRK